MGVQGLIAECGSMHMGDVKKAREMVRIAKESGADMIKFQAIEADYVARYGSMPLAFYETCELTLSEYMELISYGDDIGIPVFYSIFAPDYSALGELYNIADYYKISGKQFLEMSKYDLEGDNIESNIISIPKCDSAVLEERRDAISKMSPMYVTPYCEAPNWGTLIRIRNVLDRMDVGLSDHSIGVENCITAIKEYDCKLIEKHFHLGVPIVWEGKVFRDSHHSATPFEFERLAKAFKEQNP